MGTPKTSFSRTIQSFLPKVQGAKTPMLFVADSALYTKKTIGDLSGKIQWVTRVPETVGLVRHLLSEVPLKAFRPEGEDLPGIRFGEVGTTFGGIPQRWILVYSQTAREREEKTLSMGVKIPPFWGNEISPPGG